MALQIEENERFEQRDWQAQRVGWVVIGLTVLAALAGLLGPGPLSTTSATSADGHVTVEYRRFARHGGDATLRVEIAGPALEGDEVEVALPREYLSQVDVESLVPEPAEARLDGSMVRYTFAVSDSSETALLTFVLKPEALWAQSLLVEVAGRELTLRQFLYP